MIRPLDTLKMCEKLGLKRRSPGMVALVHGGTTTIPKLCAICLFFFFLYSIFNLQTLETSSEGKMMKDVWNGPPGFRPTKSAPSSPAKPLGLSRTRSESFHALHKVPVGDTPYVRAKNVQLVEKDPERAIPLFWAAINAGDRVDSALKDMAIVMKQQNRAEEAIEAIKSLRVRCSDQSQESLDNILLDLYKRCGRLDDQIGLLKHKLFLIQQGMAFNGKRTKTARSQGKKFQVSVEQEGTRLLGNLGWALMQKENYTEAEEAYRRALCIAPDNNKMCNLGICLMKQGRIKEAKDTLRRVKPAVVDGPRGVDSHLKAYERSQQMLRDLESEMMSRGGDDKVEQRRLFDAIFGSSSIWQPQPCRESTATVAEPKVAPLWQPHPSKVDSIAAPRRWDDCYGDENNNVNVTGNSGRALIPPLPLHRSNKDQNGNSLNVDAQPFICSEKLKRTRSSPGTNAASPVARRRLSLEKTATDSGLLPDNKDFEEAILAAVLGTQTKTSQRLKVFQDITLSLSPRP